jgi:hypothetical protein
MLWCIHISIFLMFKRNNCKKLTGHNQIQTWPAHSNDVPTHTIWTLYMYIQTKVTERKLKISIFCFKFKRDNAAKNQRTITKFELDLHIPMEYLHMQLEPYTILSKQVSKRKLKIPVHLWQKNHRTMTKFQLDLHTGNPMNQYPYPKFELNVCNHCRNNEQKPMMMEWPNKVVNTNIC